MTPDHHPYLRPGVDLITAEDVLDAMGDPYAFVWEAEETLRARLDRERRQACRRGALDAWERFAWEVRSWGRRPAWSAAMGAAVWDGTGNAARARCAERMLRYLADALAYRAAARAKP